MGVGFGRVFYRSLGTWISIGALAFAVTACTSSPKQQGDREKKAAGVPSFKLHMTKDLWNRTNITRGGHQVDKPLSLTDEAAGMVTIELTGPQMVDYIRTLDFNAHGGDGATDTALAANVYDAIAPVLDKIQTNPAPGTTEPEISINGAVAVATATP